MANPVLGKSLCSDWFFLGQVFAVWTVSMEKVQSAYFCFKAKPANSKFATKTAKKKSVKIVILHIETTVEPRLSGPRLSGLFDYPDFFSGPVFFMNINKL